MFFLFIFVLIFLLVVGLAIHTSKLGIEIENLIIDTEQPKGQKINKDSKIFLYILLFDKIKLFKKDIKNDKSIKIRNKLLDIRLFQKEDLKIDYKELFKNLNIFVKEINLNIQLGTQDAALTAILTGIISAGLGIILRKPKYEVIPIYSDKNFLKIKLDGIFSVHLMQYIYKLIYKKIKNLGNASLNKKVEV